MRVDDGCYARLTDKPRGSQSPVERPFLQPYSAPRVRSSMQPRDARVDDSFDEDLKKALEMSLEEVKGHSGAGYVPQSKLKAKQKPPPIANGTKSGSNADVEEDEELKAAIAASLQDMEEQKRKHAKALKEKAAKATSVEDPKAVLPKPEYELTPVEAENINLFSTLVDRLQHQPPGTILREPQIQELYESIGTLRPKLARTYGETMSKHGESSRSFLWLANADIVDTLLDLHAKLATVVRYYDRMLEERLSHTYGQHNLGGGYNAQHARPGSNMYPSLPPGPPSGLPNGTTGAESFYTGGPPSSSGPYGQAPTPYDQHPPSMSPQAYTRGPNPTSMGPIPTTDPRTYQQPAAHPQRAPSLQGYASTPSQKSETSYFQESPNTSAQPQVSPLHRQPSNPPYYGANQNVSSPAPDPTQYYKDNSTHSNFYSQGQSQEQYQATPQPPVEQYQQTTPMQPPATNPAVQQPHAPPQHAYQPTSNPNPSYWQPQTQQPFQAQPQPPPAASTSYTQSSFPVVPTHQPQPQPQPQPKPVEEALIEL